MNRDYFCLTCRYFKIKFVPLHLVMNDFTEELAKLHLLTGAEFSRQVERIVLRKEFHPLDTDDNIFSVGGEIE